MAKKEGKSHRELIDTGTDKRFVRRDDKGQFEEVDDVGRSLARDRQQKAKTEVPSGQGDQAIRRDKRVLPTANCRLFSRRQFQCTIGNRRLAFGNVSGGVFVSRRLFFLIVGNSR